MTEIVTIPVEEYDAIISRYPWIRSRDPFAYLCRGWVDLAVTMLDAMDDVLKMHPGAVVTGWYTKEKFGGLRVHFGLDGVPEAAGIWPALRGPVDRAAEASLRTCEVCGASGCLRDAAGWFVTRCDDHAPSGEASH